MVGAIRGSKWWGHSDLPWLVSVDREASTGNRNTHPLACLLHHNCTEAPLALVISRQQQRWATPSSFVVFLTVPDGPRRSRNPVFNAVANHQPTKWTHPA